MNKKLEELKLLYFDRYDKNKGEAQLIANDAGDFTQMLNEGLISVSQYDYELDNLIEEMKGLK
jgi:hypothetical protein